MLCLDHGRKKTRSVTLLEQLFTKKEKTMEKCVCGSSKHDSAKCPQCDGRGRVGHDGILSFSGKCSHCNGTGRVCPKGN